MSRTSPHNPFNPGTPVAPALFVNREVELRQLEHWRQSGTAHILVVGERGIGKTSLVRNAFQQGKADAANTLTLFRTMYPFYGRGFDAFFSDLLLEICNSIWQQLLGKQYSELLEEPSPLSRGGSSEEALVRKIHRIATARTLTTRRSSDRHAGAKAVLEAGVSVTSESGQTRDSLRPFEFLELIGELQGLLNQHDRSRILVVADEFNYLPVGQNEEFFHILFETLRSKSIQFALVGFMVEPQGLPGLANFIESIVRLGPFDIQATQQLFRVAHDRFAANGGKPSITFGQDTIEVIHALTKGHPLWIQRTAGDCYRLAVERGQESVSAQLAATVHSRLELERRNLSGHKQGEVGGAG